MLWIQKPCQRFNAWHLTVAAVLALAGCGGEGGGSFGGLHRYPVKGKVLLADGKPLTGGHIVFLSDAPPASASADIGSDGSFEFKGPSGDGLPEAKYKVHLTLGPPAGGVSGGRGAAVKLAFASKYLEEDTSGLTATVTTDESKNQFAFKLDATNATGPSSSPGGRR